MSEATTAARIVTRVSGNGKAIGVFASEGIDPEVVCARLEVVARAIDGASVEKTMASTGDLQFPLVVVRFANSADAQKHAHSINTALVAAVEEGFRAR